MFPHMVRKFKIEIFNNYEYLNITREYDHMKTNLERLRYGEHLLEKYKRIFMWESGMKVHNKKSDEMSISLRVEGNNFHDQGEYAKAVICYNKSLCFAASSVNIAIGYSNRSASLYEMGRFEECKQNIRLARELNPLPEILKKKLDNRIVKCGNEDQGCLQNNKTIKELNLTYRKHRSLPFIINRLEIKQEGCKSWIYAKKYIEPGTVIMKEEIFNFVVLPTGYFTYCHFCLKASGDLIPCPDCTSAMFCNNDCMKRANDEFHKWECPIIDLLNSFGDMQRFSFRLLLHMLHIFGDYDQVEKYWKELPQNSVSWFSMNQAKLTRTEQFRIFHSSEKPTIRNEVRKLVTFSVASVGSVFFTVEIMKHSDLKRIFQTKEQCDLFAEIIFHHTILLTNYNNLVTKLDDSVNFQTMYAIGYPLIKEIKSTYSPNVYEEWDGNHMIWSASRPIKKGESLQKGIKPSPDDGYLELLLMEMGSDTFPHNYFS